MWFPGFFAFESVSKPSYFVRLSQTEELLLDRYDGTSTFKEDASFMLKKRPCASKITFHSMQIGSLVKTGLASEIFRRGADSSDEGAKIWFSGCSKCQKSPKKSLFTFRRGV